MSKGMASPRSTYSGKIWPLRGNVTGPLWRRRGPRTSSALLQSSDVQPAVMSEATLLGLEALQSPGLLEV